MAENIKYETLKNKSVIITGGASGLGLATGTRWAEHGAYVTLADQNAQQGEAVVADLAGKGHKVTFVQCDVTSWSSSVTAFKHAVNFSPRKTLDIAALFAGIGGDAGALVDTMAKENPEPSLDKDPAEPSSKVVDVNLDGQLKSTELALYYFKLAAATDSPAVAEGPKSLFLVASLAGYIDYPPTLYCISKYGTRGLFRSLRGSAKQTENNFTVNLVAPGYTKTPMTIASYGGQVSRPELVDFATAKGLWAPVEAVVDAASYAVTGGYDVNGRSFSTWPSGFKDMNEDLESGYGGMQLLKDAEESGYRQAGII